jgi:hypothetical protein
LEISSKRDDDDDDDDDQWWGEFRWRQWWGASIWHHGGRKWRRACDALWPSVGVIILGIDPIVPGVYFFGRSG